MTTPKSRPMNDAGTTADARQATESPTGSREKRGAREADAVSDGGGKQTIESSEREASLGQRPTRDDGANDDLGELA